MEFLPVIAADGSKVYAGFWLRIGALFIDIVIFSSVIPILVYFQSVNLSMAIFAAVLNVAIYYSYSIYFLARYGGTLGKLIVGIRVTKPDGGKIGFKQAILRSSVDLLLALIVMVYQIHALLNINYDIFTSTQWHGRIRLLRESYPSSYINFDRASMAWTWGEFVVLLTNKYKRALHDYIAGTVVIHKRYAEHAPPAGRGEAPRP